MIRIVTSLTRIFLAKITDWNVTNGGESGATTIRWWTTDFPKFNYTNFIAAIIKLGQNGGLTDTLAADIIYAGTNTGAYCKIIEGMLAQNPNLKIFLVSIQNASDTVTNGVIQQIAPKYNLPYLDISNNGIYTLTDSNYHTVLNGTSYGVHFNTIGYLTLAKVIYMMMMDWIENNWTKFKDF
ncbi:SGNH/GDSL hydrolase family protein [Peribacillus sp. SCS-26]|uniref:SGNH/GDSL hydrolase family protein n=1 Tax=Paraperibacillus marinus TaxID=3115295 RepID=UPI0039063C66